MHIPVLLKETIDLLNIRRGGKYIDATLGLGGHSLGILKRGGIVLGIEVDEESLKEAKKRIASSIDNYQLTINKFVRGNFKDLRKIALEHGFVPCDGVLFDLGMSSWQLEESGRGFSFQKDEPLDMRMDKSLAVTAADLLNGLSNDELTKLFQKYGEEQFARRIASAVVRARTLKPLRTTGNLVDVVLSVNKGRRGRVHPATKVFQALRIAVNDEIGNLRSALPQAFEILAPRPAEENPSGLESSTRRVKESAGSGQAGGRVAVISFHSLEDREVKHFFKKLADKGVGKLVTKKPIAPSAREIRKNPRARSAKLRVVERVK